MRKTKGNKICALFPLRLISDAIFTWIPKIHKDFFQRVASLNKCFIQEGRISFSYWSQFPLFLWKTENTVLILKIYCWNFFGFFKNVSDISDHQFKFMLCFAPLLCLLIMNYHEMFLRRLEWWLTQPSEDWRLYNNTSWWCVENPTYNVLSQLSSGTLTLFLLFTQFMQNDSAQKLNNLKRIVHSHFITEQVDFYS